MRRRVRTGQLIAAEATVVAVIAAAFAPGWVFLGVAILAVAVLVATFGRAGGRWWYESVALSRRYRRRRAVAAAQVLYAALSAATQSGTADRGPAGSLPPALAWLRTLAPTLSMRRVAVGTSTVGVGADEDGWFAVVEIGALWDDDTYPAPHEDPAEGSAASPWAPGAVTARLLPRDQSAVHAVPYRELAALVEQVSAVQVVLVPGLTPAAPRPAWVAVRVRPGDALATERAGGVSAVERTVAAAALKAVRTLETAGWAARAVPPDGLVPALVEATGLDGPPQEHWSYWRCGRGVRTHYAVSGWTPDHGTLAPGVSQLAVCLSGTADLDRAAVLAVVAAPPPVLGRVCRGVVASTAAQTVRLERLDGEQAPAAYAGAPTAAVPNRLVPGAGTRVALVPTASTRQSPVSLRKNRSARPSRTRPQ